MTLYRFDEFTFDSETGRLDHAHRPAQRLRPKSAQALAFLLDHAGEIVTREQLVDTVWAEERLVDFEAGLSAILRDIRRALDDSASEPRYLETIPRRGYRFLREARVAPRGRGCGERSGRWRTAALIAVGVLAVTTAMVFWFFVPSGDRFAGQLAVAPITVYPEHGGKPGTSWVLTDTLIAELWKQRPPGLQIVGRSSLERRQSDQQTAKAFGRQLGVDWVLYGFLRKRDGKWSLTLNLYRLPEARLQWSKELEAGKSPEDDADRLATRSARALAQWAAHRD